MRILIVEDNPDIVANLYGYFEPKGYVLDSAGNGYAGMALAAQHTYDVIVLDISLPGLDGIEICHRLRTELKNPTPVLMLTARDTLLDKEAGFSSGADDYLVKPYALAELDMRLKALARRARGDLRDLAQLRVGDLVFNTDTFEATRAGIPLVLTKTGYTILKCLMRGAPHIVTRETIENAIWRDDRPDSDALRTHLHALRQAIDKPFPLPMLRTVPGVGYKLVASDETT